MQLIADEWLCNLGKLFEKILQYYERALQNQAIENEKTSKFKIEDKLSNFLFLDKIFNKYQLDAPFREETSHEKVYLTYSRGKLKGVKVKFKKIYDFICKFMHPQKIFKKF
jgi:hypothetical protein